MADAWTFDPTPLGMVSAYDALYSPYQHGHMEPEASLDPVGFYFDQPYEYGYSPNDYHQWWHDMSEKRKEGGGVIDTSPPAAP